MSKSTKLLNERNLRAAINYWRNEKPNWDPDFHNHHYHELEKLKRNGFTKKWWKEMVDLLWYWRAIRPKTKKFIYERGLERLDSIETEYMMILDDLPNKYAGMENGNWTYIYKLFSTTSEIKNVNSPVFPSKMCHFMLPNQYPVIDWEAVGVRTNHYQHY